LIFDEDLKLQILFFSIQEIFVRAFLQKDPQSFFDQKGTDSTDHDTGEICEEKEQNQVFDNVRPAQI
jgi:hypothetical protein